MLVSGLNISSYCRRSLIYRILSLLLTIQTKSFEVILKRNKIYLSVEDETIEFSADETIEFSAELFT